MAIARIETDGIEDGAVDSSKILDGILGAADIPNDSLTNVKFSNSAAIPTSKLTGLATSATTDTTNATNITSGSLATARVDVGTTAGKILQVDGSGNMPAIDGSLLTGIESFTKSASDPTISTNPSGGVGTEWVNTTSGEIYLCTDATAGANVWTNVGAGSDSIIPYIFQGTTYGYSLGGSDGVDAKTVAQISFTSDGNATDVANLFYGVSDKPCGQTSKTHGYVTGGYNYGGGGLRNEIQKIAFANPSATGTDVGNLLSSKSYLAGQSSEDYGFVSGSYYPSATNVIERFSFTTDGNSTDWADISTSKGYMSGHNSLTHGYNAGGYTGSFTNVIEKFPFASQTNSSDVGDLTNSIGAQANVSSTTHGYAAGGSSISVINKWTFATDANATDAGDLTLGRTHMCGVTSTTHGYACGGDSTNVIDKFSTVSDANATDVGDLVGGSSPGYNAGVQT